MCGSFFVPEDDSIEMIRAIVEYSRRSETLSCDARMFWIFIVFSAILFMTDSGRREFNVGKAVCTL